MQTVLKRIVDAPLFQNSITLVILIAGVVVGFLTLVTCGLGLFVFVPMASFYLQNVAYNRGLLR